MLLWCSTGSDSISSATRHSPAGGSAHISFCIAPVILTSDRLLPVAVCLAYSPDHSTAAPMKTPLNVLCLCVGAENNDKTQKVGSQRRLPKEGAKRWMMKTDRMREKGVNFFTSDAFWVFHCTQIVHCCLTKVGDGGPKNDSFSIIFHQTGNLCVRNLKATKIGLYPSSKQLLLPFSPYF